MRILVISQMFPCKRHPTSAIFFANLIRELAPKVEELVVITPRVYIPKCLTYIKKRWSKWYLDPMSSKEHGVEIIRPYYPALRGAAYEGINGLLMYLFLYRMIRRLIIKKGIEVVLGYNMLPEGIASVRLAKRLGLPVGFWAIGTDVNDLVSTSRMNFSLAKNCIEESDLILAESKDLESKIRSMTLQTVKVKTFYKGIDVSNFQDLPSKEEARRRLQMDPLKRYLLFVGRLICDKGIYELAEAFATISKKHTDVELILIGEEIEKGKIINKLHNLNIVNKVHFKGILPYSEIGYYMKAADALVFPTWAEGLPNVVMEAMASDLPVVTTDVGGIPEILKSGINGLSVPVKDVTKLAEATLRMIEDQTLRKYCTANAREMIYEKYDVKKNVNELYDLLMEMKTVQPGR